MSEYEYEVFWPHRSLERVLGTSRDLGTTLQEPLFPGICCKRWINSSPCIWKGTSLSTTRRKNWANCHSNSVILWFKGEIPFEKDCYCIHVYLWYKIKSKLREVNWDCKPDSIQRLSCRHQQSLYTLLCPLTTIRIDKETNEAVKFRGETLWYALTLVIMQPRGLDQRSGDQALLL